MCSLMLLEAHHHISKYENLNGCSPDSPFYEWKGEAHHQYSSLESHLGFTFWGCCYMQPWFGMYGFGGIGAGLHLGG